MEYTDKKIGFASNLVPLIENGEKTFTYRLESKWNFLSQGDVIPVADSATEKIFGKAEIISKDNVTFGQLPNEKEGHESYSSDDDRRSVFAGYYSRPVDDSEPFIIFGFKFLKN